MLRQFRHDDPGEHAGAHSRRRGPDPDRRGGFGRGGFGRGMGPGRPFGFGGGFGGFGGGFGGFGRGPMVRRGEVRPAILAVLVDGPMHGYQVMQELRQRSGGAWAPSAGSVYPTLQQLEDEGLVRGEERDGRRVFTLTDDGRAEAAKVADGATPWATDRGPDETDFRVAFMQVAQAAMQVGQVGSPAAIAEARRILAAARRDLYGLLATDGQTGASGSPTAPSPEAPEA